MSKTNQIKKVINGEIADADDINQIVENAGSEGGSIPYDPTSHERSTDGSQSLGSTAYPWGDLNVEEDASLNEIASDTLSPSVASTVLIKNLRKFLFLKDCPSSFSGKALQVARVNSGETALEFSTMSIGELYTSSGTFVCPAGINKVFVTMVGGGGGGGGYRNSDDRSGGGGGSGAWCKRIILDVTALSEYTVTVGTGGAGGAYQTSGAAGGNSSFEGDNHTITANGGSGGTYTGLGGAGGVGSGSYDASTSTAGTPEITAGGSGGNQASNNVAGAGGGNPFGYGGESGGGDGFGNGSGGGGKHRTTGTTGGSGADGFVLVEYF